MQLKTLLFLALTSLAAATPTPTPAEEGIEIPGAQCGYPNGNCYQNGCEGNPSSLRCSAGPYIGCDCGYGCGSNTGPCNANGCDGNYNTHRCTGKYLGCNCY